MKCIIGYIAILSLFLFFAGCVSDQQTAQALPPIPNPYNVATISPTINPTFQGVNYFKPVVNPDVYQPEPTVGPSLPPITDPIIGGWNLVNGPYECNAIFAEDYSGHLDCGELGVSEQKNIQWSHVQTGDPINQTYLISFVDLIGPDNQTEAIINGSGIMTVDILPGTSYLVKNP